MKITNKIFSGTVVTVVCLACTASPLMGGINIYLNIPGVNGEVTDTGYQKQIGVSSFSGGISNVSTNNTSGLGGKNLAFAPLSIQKNLDSASTPLYLNCAQGTKLQDPVVLTVAKTSSTGTLQAFYTLTLSNVYVTSVSTGGVAAGGVPNESLSLTYGSIQWSYTPQTPTGQLGTPIVHGWSLITQSGY